MSLWQRFLNWLNAPEVQNDHNYDPEHASMSHVSDYENW